MKRSYWLALAIVVVLIFLVTWEGLESPPRESFPRELDEEPDFYMEGAEISQFDHLGELRYRMRADRVSHYTARNITELVAPHLILFEDPSPWEVSSVAGTIHHEVGAETGSREVVELVDDVKLERRSSESDFIEVTTSALTLYPDRKYAETDQAVMIETHTGRTTAHGLRADLQTGQLTLYSGVHTVVLPETL